VCNYLIKIKINTSPIMFKQSVSILLCCSLTLISAQQQQQQQSTTTQSSTTTAKPTNFLALPDPQKCSKRPKEFFYEGHWYFFSGNVTKYRGSEWDWLEARNACREYCMDSVSIETQEENDLIKDLVKSADLKYIWTSGRLCDFKGCKDRADLQPPEVNGWFWSGSGTKMAPTNKSPPGWGYQPWSFTGRNKIPQPDQAELGINGTPESCLAMLNNVYGDGIHWHDVACYHEKQWVCEDSDELLQYVRATNPGLPI